MSSQDRKDTGKGQRRFQTSARTTSRIDIDLKEVVKAGCQPSQAQIAKMMDNPVGSLVFIANQFYWTSSRATYRQVSTHTPTSSSQPSPSPIGESWNLINRPSFT